MVGMQMRSCMDEICLNKEVRIGQKGYWYALVDSNVDEVKGLIVVVVVVVVLVVPKKVKC